MSALLIGICGIIVLLSILMLGMPVGFSMMIVGFGGMACIIGVHSALPQIHSTLYSVVSNYSYTVVPFFILMGYFAAVSRMSTELYSTAEKWLRRFPGGLALATIAGCASFAAISGSSAATAATMGTVALPEMIKHKYDKGFAAGSVAAGGTLGFLIPPSIAFVVYGIVTEVSVGKLLLAGIIPGFLLAITYMLVIVLRVRINPGLAPQSGKKPTWAEKFKSLKAVWGVILVFLMVMGSMYIGVCTPTEAGALGAFVLFIIAAAKRTLTWKSLIESLLQTAKVSAMIFMIVYGAMLFSSFLALSQIPAQLAAYIGGLDVSRYIVLLLIILLFLVLGCFIESVPLIILAMPIVYPIAVNLQFDPIWLGVISVMMIEAALITPPVGMTVYVTAGTVRNIPVSDIFRNAFPFLAAIFLMVTTLVIFPDICLVLPRLIMK